MAKYELYYYYFKNLYLKKYLCKKIFVFSELVQNIFEISFCHSTRHSSLAKLDVFINRVRSSLRVVIDFERLSVNRIFERFACRRVNDDRWRKIKIKNLITKKTTCAHEECDLLRAWGKKKIFFARLKYNPDRIFLTLLYFRPYYSSTSERRAANWILWRFIGERPRNLLRS